MSDGVDKETKNLIEKGTRTDKRIKAEDLVANELVTATLSEPMNKIRHICETLMSLDENEKKAADISEEEEKQAEKIYKLSQILSHTHIDKFETADGKTIKRSATISWGFPLSKAENYLDWIEDHSWELYTGGKKRRTEKKEKAKKKKEEDKPLQGLMIVTRDRCTIATYNRILNQFIDYAMPKVVKLSKKIIQTISSSTRRKALEKAKSGENK